MEFPGSSSWEFFDVHSYQRAREAAGAPLPVATPQAPSGPAAAGAEDLAGQLADLRLGRAERHRASDAGAALAPRNAPPGIGGSMRLPAQAAAALVGRDNHFHSTRRLYVPESPPDSPEPYDAPQPARHSSACASYATRFDPTPRRKGSFMSGLKKGVVKGLKSALGFGGSGNSSKAFSSSARSASSRHSVDSFSRRDSTLRMDPHSPGRELARTVIEEGADQGSVSEHGSPPAEVPVQQPARPSRRRPRDDEDWESSRRVAGSAMRAPETTLAPPDPARGSDVHEQDCPLLDRAWAALTANRRIPAQTRKSTLQALTWLSAWLNQVGKLPMEGRLFSKELMLDAWKFVRLGGDSTATSAVRHLRDMETTGVAEITRRQRRNSWEVPEADRHLIEEAFGGIAKYKRAALTFSEWLAREELPALTDFVVDDDGITRAALHTDDVSHLAEAYKRTQGAQYVGDVTGALAQLRIFDTTGATAIKHHSHHFGIPEVDQRLITRYQAEGNKRLQDAAERENSRLGDNRGYTVVDKYANSLRAFSEWRQKQQLPPIAAQLHDGNTLRDQVDLFAEPKSFNARGIRTALKAMLAMFPPEAPGVTIARIGPSRFVEALGSLVPGNSVADVADRLGANVDDLLVFLDARADDGLTQAGRDMVNTFDGALLQAVRANIALRQQMMALGEALGESRQAPARTSPSFGPMPTPSGGWPNVYSWPGEASRHQPHGAPADSVRQGTDTVFGELSSLQSDARHGFDLNTPAEVEQPSGPDPAFSELSPINSAHRYGGQASYPGTPQEVVGPSSLQPSGWPHAPDLGQVIVGGWLHGDHYATPELTHALAMEGALPTPYMPRTAVQIRGERYAAHLVDGAVLLSWIPAPGAELPHGYAAIDRDTLLGRIGAQMGRASGQGLNCLLDSIVQLARNIPRQARPMPALDRQVQRMRDMLTTVGAIEQRGELDVYEHANVGALLAANFSVRLQFIQEDEHRRVFVHPVIGQEGPLVRILHTPGHFQPLWPAQP